MATSWYLFISVWFISHQNHRVVIQEWSLNEPLTLLQSMSSGSEPPDKQYLSTIFKFFSKDSFWLKFDERKSSVLYTTFIGWFNRPIFSDVWVAIIMCSNIRVFFFTLTLFTVNICSWISNHTSSYQFHLLWIYYYGNWFVLRENFNYLSVDIPMI